LICYKISNSTNLHQLRVVDFAEVLPAIQLINAGKFTLQLVILKHPRIFTAHLVISDVATITTAVAVKN